LYPGISVDNKSSVFQLCVNFLLFKVHM